MAHPAEHPTSTDESMLAGTVREVDALEGVERNKERSQDRFADWITNTTGSITFVTINVVWFVSWVMLNLPGMPTQFDPFPLHLLTLLVALEAIVLSVFVLMSENAQARRADRRWRIEMQVNVVAEREISKLVTLVAEIHEQLGLERHPRNELLEMQGTTHLDQIAEAVDGTIAQLGSHDPSLDVRGDMAEASDGPQGRSPAA